MTLVKLKPAKRVALRHAPEGSGRPFPFLLFKLQGVRFISASYSDSSGPISSSGSPDTDSRATTILQSSEVTNLCCHTGQKPQYAASWQTGFLDRFVIHIFLQLSLDISCMSNIPHRGEQFSQLTFLLTTFLSEIIYENYLLTSYE
jgi:hypothetical protein